MTLEFFLFLGMAVGAIGTPIYLLWEYRREAREYHE